MKRNNLYKVMSVAGVAASFCLVQGCSTIHSGGEAEDMRLRPMPSALDPAPVQVQPFVADGSYSTIESTAPVNHSFATARPQLTTSYTVKKGDNLSSIAYRYKLRWQDVAAVNPNINPNKLFVGEVIQLPGKVDVVHAVRSVATPHAASSSKSSASGSYVVKPGESLSLIAHRNHIKVADLKAANKLTNDKIMAGQKLVIPGATTKLPQVKKETVKPVITTPPAVAPVAAPALEPPVAPVPALDPLELQPMLDTTINSTTVAPPPPALPDPATVVGTAAPTVGYQNHTVAPGEDLYAVAIRWGVGTAEIKAANNLTGSELVPGTVLKIPPATTP